MGLATKKHDTTGKERHVLADLVPLWWERRLHRRALLPLQDRSGQRRRDLAELFRPSSRMPTASPSRMPRARAGARRTGRRAPMANWSVRSTATGARSPSRPRRPWPRRPRRLGAATDPVADVLQATRDSIRAIMMIRAYRMRGHLHADLDPLKMKADEPAPELDPTSYGFTEADYGRKIFIDNYLGLEYATIPEMLAILKRTYCGTVGIEFMHISDPEAKQWIQERIEGPDKEITFTPEGKKAILNKLIEAEGFEKFIDVKYTGTKRFGLDGCGVADPGARADHQARRRAGHQGHRAGHGPSRPPQRADPGDAEAASRAVPRVQGRRLLPRRRRGLGRREVPSGCFVGPRVRRQQGASVADGQSEPSRDRRSGGAGQGARQAGPAYRRPTASWSTSPRTASPTARWCCRC